MKLQRPDPGIDAAKSGLHGKAGIFFNAGLFSKGGGFNPLDLDPYLLFDARTSMIGTLENPTLDLDPSKQDTLDVITATRAGTATFTDVNGNIATASADTVRVDYTQGPELTPTKFQRIGYTDFSQGWAAQSGVVAQGADDYQGNAVRRLTFDGVTTGGIYQTTINTIGGVSYTGSFYIRRISGSTPLYMRHGFSASGNQTAISVTTEWQQFSVTMLGASGGGNVYFGILQFGAGNDVYEITQPQFEEGTTASSFVANTSGSPKFIASAVYGPRVPMILVEPSSENLLPYSEDFSNAAWVKNDTSITSSAATSPDGANNASLLTVNSSSVSYLREFFTISATAHTFSIYAKAGTATDIQLYVVEQGITSGTADVNIETGEVTNVTSNWNGGVTTEDVGDGWFRIKGTRNFTTSAPNHGIGIAATGQNGLNCYIWGAQVETGSVATSYIPTSGSTAQRASDELVISGSDFSDFFNGSAGTFFIQAQNRTPELNGAVLMGQNSNKLFFYKSNPNRLSTYDGGSFTHHDGLVPNQLFNAAVTFNTSNRSSSLDGSALDTDTINTQWAGADILKIGFGYSNNFNGHYRRILFWPYHSDSL
jgi:hypothetical protein